MTIAGRIGRLLLGKKRYERVRASLRQTRQKSAELENAYRVRLENLVEVTQPLVLISQAHRSGGALLNRLLEGHHECHSFPGELQIGHPHKTIWPTIDLRADPEQWLYVLGDKSAMQMAQLGYADRRTRRSGEKPLPFIFSAHLQRRIFEKQLSAIPPSSVRDVFNAHFTAYFNAWLDNQNLYPAPKRYITGFVPRMNMHFENIESFFAVYPDGHHISLVRNPCSWVASVFGQKDRTAEQVREMLTKIWCVSAQATITAKERFPERVYVIPYESLVTSPPAVMESLAKHLTIEFSQSLLNPTFNRTPIKPNSSFEMSTVAVTSDAVDRYKQVLTDQEIELVDSIGRDLYLSASALSPGLS